jgi:hypothetical protein
VRPRIAEINDKATLSQPLKHIDRVFRGAKPNLLALSKQSVAGETKKDLLQEPPL